MDTINGKGVNIVLEAEGKPVITMPWEVEGEKDGLSEAKKIIVTLIELKTKEMYEHMQVCTESDCGVVDHFEAYMKMRRALLPIKEVDTALYTSFIAILFTCITKKGNFPKVASFLLMVLPAIDIMPDDPISLLKGM